MEVLPDKRMCCGCSVCEKVCPQKCISMITDEEGFWYPQIDIHKCTGCDKCRNTCPVNNEAQIKEPIAKKITYAAIATDDNILLRSSSGGIFSLLAEATISSGGVVYGASFTDDFRRVCHVSVEMREKLDTLRGSKYVQSYVGDTYQEVKKQLDSGRHVLFSGVPCQIEGLKRYLGREYENLICIDLVCHGVPSPKVWTKYLAHQERNADSKVSQIEFRCKDSGWRNYSIRLKFSSGAEYKKQLSDDLYMQAFLRNISLRPSCARCSFKKTGRISDITMGDFWGIEKVVPELDDNKGVSLVIVHTEKGMGAIKSIEERIILREVDMNQAISGNAAMVRSVSEHHKREEFFKNLDSMAFDVAVKRYAKQKLTIKSIIAKALRKTRLIHLMKKFCN